MAEDEGLRISQFRVAPSLVRFAQSKGWRNHQYSIYYKTNPEWGRIHILFIAEGFNDQDEYEATREVWAFIEKDLSHEPDILDSINLVVRSQKKVNEGGLYAVGSGYQKFWVITPVNYVS
jgi:hypothetical protein